MWGRNEIGEEEEEVHSSVRHCLLQEEYMYR